MPIYRVVLHDGTERRIEADHHEASGPLVVFTREGPSSRTSGPGSLSEPIIGIASAAVERIDEE